MTEMIREKVQIIFRDVFDDDTLVIRDSSNASEISEWDSLMHINLIAAIEQEFDIKFSVSEVTNLKNVGEIIEAVAKKCYGSNI